MGGEKILTPLWIPVFSGSPPHGRGKGCTCCCASPLARITPAWAGKSYTEFRFLHAKWDHPRVGGEKSSHAACCPGWIGSPPRRRGKAEQNTGQILTKGITPA